MNAKPKTLAPIFENIPTELRKLNQWVMWRWTLKDGKWTKPPLCAITLHPVSVTRPPWGKYTEVTCWKGIDGIGFVLTEEDPYVAIDLDKCRDDKGEIEGWAREIMDALPTYCEISPSGTGIRLIAKGKLPGPRCRKGKIEMYDHARYITLTGHGGNLRDIADCQEQLDRLYEVLFAEPKNGTVKTKPAWDDDDRVLTLCRTAANGDKFANLYQKGDWQKDYTSQSEADLALCSMLAFWTQDTNQIDRIFRASSLYRPKWDRSLYAMKTINKALEGEHYQYSDPRLNDPDLVTPKEKDTGYDDFFLDTVGFFNAAGQETTRYLIDPYLVAGGLNFISGLSFAGKTVFALWCVGRIMQGKDILGHATEKVDVVYINGDLNPKQRLAMHLAAGLGDQTPPGWHYLKHNPTTLTADLLRHYASLAWSKRGKDKHILFVLDTLRPLIFMDAKRGDDLDSVAMTQKMKPFKDFTNEMGGRVTLWIGYHNARTTGEYYGSGAFMNMVDSYWNYQRNPDHNHATVQIQTRDMVDSLVTYYEPGKGFFQKQMDLSTTLENIVVLAQKDKVSQNRAEKELGADCKRELVRVAYRHLNQFDILDEKGVLQPQWKEKLDELYFKLGWAKPVRAV